MTYLLDTCILSKLRRISKYPDPKLEQWITEYPLNQFSISAFSIAEIQIGISKLDETLSDGKKFKTTLEDWLLNTLVRDFEGRIHDFDLKLALRWGALVGKLKQRGINLPIVDSLIAATAIHHELILVTENSSDFEHTDVMLLNPWKI